MLLPVLGMLLAAAPESSYADVRGLHMYYELHGQGPPVVLLHGGLSTVAGTFTSQITLLSQDHRVIAPEQMGHGHTRDADRPFRYQDMAEDTAALLEKLHVASADVVGWSDGGIIGLLLAAHHPALVRKLVVSGANARPDGLDPKSRAWLERTAPEDWPQRIKDDYAQEFVDGAAHWPIILDRLRTMWLHFEITPKELASIKAPTLVMCGDHDQVRLEHTMEIFRTIPNAQLFIVPGSGHNTFNMQPDLVNAELTAFLTAPMPENH